VSKSGQGTRDLGDDRARALALVPVSRETEARLDIFVETLLRWQSKINLIAPSTLPELWTRHVADSLQLLDLAPGFPGIPIACALAGQTGARVHLVESNGKKAAFLRAAVKATAVPAFVHHLRIEKFGETCAEAVQVVTARALAPLKTLCVQAFPFVAKGAIALFPKGQDVEAELTDAAKYWSIDAETVTSRTSPDGCIVLVRRLKRLKS
jgi:16S rRNA (guanine527-N7)-methyltransferase